MRKAFKTQNGRTVFDGGGVKPDVVVPENKLTNMTKSLEKNFFIFDFATHYRSEHENIKEIKNFKLTDMDFAEFKNYVNTHNFNYNTTSEIALTTLKEKAIEEDYIGTLKNEIEALENSLKAIKMKDLEKNKDEILELLRSEIARRYYYEEAVIESTFTADSDVLKALEVFNDKAQYQLILTVK